MGLTRLIFLNKALHAFGASVVAHLVKNLPAVRDTWVLSLGGNIPWRRDILQYPGLENSMDCSPWDCKELDLTE